MNKEEIWRILRFSVGGGWLRGSGGGRKGGKLRRVQVNSEQVSLDSSLAEAGERLCCPDVGSRSSVHRCSARTEESCDLANVCLCLLVPATPLKYLSQALKISGYVRNSTNKLRNRYIGTTCKIIAGSCAL